MTLKLFMPCSILFLLTGCELLQPTGTTQETDQTVNKKQICLWDESSQTNDCDIEYWLRYWSKIDDTPWTERKKQIKALSNEDIDVLKKIFLSQGKSTPYQDRLRAQVWAESLFPRMSDDMKRFISVSLYQPSQDLLEMESALVTLSKINTHQSSSIEEQKALLDKQRSQIEQLLNIETSIMESTEEEK